MLLHGLRSTLRRHIRRRRRMLAAALAAAAVVIGLASLDRSAVSAEAIAVDPGSPARLAVGQVAVPIELASSSLAQALAVGDVVDVVGMTGSEQVTATVVAANARVIDLPASGGFGSVTSPVVVVAVDPGDALDVSTAAANGGLSVLIRERAPR